MASRNTPGTSGSNMTKAERLAAAREAARKLHEEEKRRAKRNRLLVIIASIVVVALVVAAVAVIVNSKDDAANSAGSSDAPQYTAFTVGDNALPSALPTNVDSMGGISVGSSLVAGSVNEGKPVVRVYFDYLCTHCNDLEAQYGETLSQMAKDGKITLVYQPVEIIGQKFSTIGAAADFFLAEHAPEQYVDFHNKVFADLSNPVFKKQADLPTLDDLLKVAKEVGVSDDVVADLKTTLENGSLDSLVEQATTQFTNNGLTGTPSVIINDQKLTNWNTALINAINEAQAA
ncbi:thioredoxin domain-containing protein [Arcanobacterium haemolyticum]|nr:thioredoxin domain-containing protein [Arcanobacterium haemolyticum]